MPQRSGYLAKSIAIGACAALLGFMLFRGYALTQETRRAKKEYADIEKKLEQAKLDLQKAQSDAAYYALPHNIEKELKSRLNYKKEGEKSIVIVPKNDGTTTPSSSAEGE